MSGARPTQQQQQPGNRRPGFLLGSDVCRQGQWRAGAKNSVSDVHRRNPSRRQGFFCPVLMLKVTWSGWPGADGNARTNPELSSSHLHRTLLLLGSPPHKSAGLYRKRVRFHGGAAKAVDREPARGCDLGPPQLAAWKRRTAKRRLRCACRTLAASHGQIKRTSILIGAASSVAVTTI